VGQSITLNPQDYLPHSEIFLMLEQQPDESPVTLTTFIKQLEKQPKQQFKPALWYNKHGDFLEIFLTNGPTVVEAAIPGYRRVEIGWAQESPRAPKEIGRILVWGVKKALLEAYANCDKPAKNIAIPAKKPDEKNT